MKRPQFSSSQVVLLWLFWVVVVGKLDPASLAIGFVVALGLAWLNADLRPDRTGVMSAPALPGLIAYLIYLVGEIVRANVQVAAIVLNPRLPISPTIARFRTRLATDVGRMLLGNSITLTPGTVTVDVEGDVFVVHALTLDSARNLGDRELERRLLILELRGDRA